MSWSREKLHELFDLSGRVALVTGGTRGIGRAIAEGFAAAGAKVVVASRKPEACAETERAIAALGGEALGVPTHLGHLPGLAELVQRSVDRFGQIDIVVNNAANALAQPIGGFTAEAWQKSFDVNLRGPVFLVQEALPHLKASPRAAHPNEMVGPALFLASDAASFVTGQVVLADGGLVPH